MNDDARRSNRCAAMRSTFVRFVVLSLALGALGCGTTATPATDGGNVLGTDAASVDGGTTPDDAGSMVDAARGDAGTSSAELCTGGLDEDGDHAIDCADSDCFDFADCMAADVAHTMTGLL